MKIVCPGCSSDYNVDDDRIPPEGMKATCPKCMTSWVVGATVGGVNVGVPGAKPQAPAPVPGVASPPSPAPLPGGSLAGPDEEEEPEFIEINIFGRMMELPNIAPVRFLLNPKLVIVTLLILILGIGTLTQFLRFNANRKEKSMSWGQVDWFALRFRDFVEADFPLRDPIDVTGDYKGNLEAGLKSLNEDTFLSFRAAEQSFRKAAKQQRGDADSRAYLAHVYARLLHYSPLGNEDKDLTSKAKVRIARSLKLKSKNSLAISAQAEVLLVQRKFAEALSQAENAERTDMNDSVSLLTLGRIHLARGATEIAQEKFQKALGIDPSMASGHYYLGLVLDKNAEYSKAEDSLKKALELSPGHTKSLLALARIKLERFHQIAEANQYLEAVLKKQKLNASKQEIAIAHYYRARAYEKEGNVEKALEEMDLARKEDARSARLVIYSGILKNQVDENFNLDSYIDGLVMDSMRDYHYYLYKGKRASQKDEIREAIDWFKKVIELDPSNADAYYQLGVIYEKDLEPDKALTSLEKALRADRGYGDAYVRLAFLQMEKRKFDEALKHLEEINSRNDRIAAVHNLMGMIAFQKKDWAKAKEKFLRALEIDVRFADAYRNLAKLSLQEKNYKETQKYLEKAKEIEPESKATKLLIAYHYRETGKYAEAIVIYEKILEKEPKNLSTLIDLGRAALGNEDWEKAEAALDRAQEIDEANVPTYHYRGIALFRQGKLDDAKTSFGHCLRFEPENPEHYIRIGEVDFVSRRISEALVNLQKAIELEPNNLEANEIIAEVYLKNGSRKDAVVHFEKTLTLTKDKKKHSEIYFKLGEIYFTDQPKKAIGFYTKALKINPKNAQAWYRRGNVYQEHSDYKRAERDYFKAIRSDRKFCEPHWKLGYIYKENNLLPKAIASLRKFLKLCPKHPEAASVREDMERMQGGGF